MGIEAVAVVCALIVGAGTATAGQPNVAPPAPTSSVNAAAAPAPYVDSSMNLANPERGFFTHQGDCNVTFNEDALILARDVQKMTLVRCIFYLRNLQKKDIPGTVLTTLSARAATVKKLGLKMVLRFAYNDDSDSPHNPVTNPYDANLTQIKRHIDQLTPFLRANSEVIHVLESGFVGLYGEGWYTDNFGNEGNLSTQNWIDRKRVVDKILQVLPANRMTQVRTVYMKSRMFGPTVNPLPVGPPPNPAAARVGVHNDCFLGSYLTTHNDQGTYRNDADRNFLASDSKYVAVGGEICGDLDSDDSRSDCPNAVNELAKYHWTHLSASRGGDALMKWGTQGCRSQVNNRLGYRLSLAGALFPSSVQRGQQFLAQVFIRNTGWSAPLSNRPVQLVLRKVGTTSLMSLPFPGANLRTWHPGTSTLLAAQFGVGSSTSPGNYELLLRLPDPSVELRAPVLSDPQNPYPYNVQLATQGVWEPTSGLNKLLRFITVT